MEKLTGANKINSAVYLEYYISQKIMWMKFTMKLMLENHHFNKKQILLISNNIK